ncbi:MAG: hypothetical protein R3C18_17020 [Planctomycetaceae bacterium]
MDDLQIQISEKAESAIEQFRTRSGDALDYSESSLDVVEEILAEASSYRHELPADQVNAITHLLGAYILEVGRRSFGGKYYWHDERDQPVLVVEERDYRIAMLVFDKIRGRLSGDEADNIPFFYRGFAAKAEAPQAGMDILFV